MKNSAGFSQSLHSSIKHLLFTLLLVVLVATSINTPVAGAFAAQQTSDGVNFAVKTSGNSDFPAGTGSGKVAVGFDGTSTAQAEFELNPTDAISVGDTVKVKFELQVPDGSSVSLLDNNGGVAGVAPVADNTNNSVPIDDSASGLGSDGIFTVTIDNTGVSTSETIRLGTLSLDPDVQGVYVLTMTPLDGSDAEITASAKTLTVQAYEIVEPVATVVQAASFASGVDLDADGNIYWADLSGDKIYKTDTAGNTALFASLDASIKLFVDGAYLYVLASAKIHRIPLSNTDPNDVGELHRYHWGRTGSTYAQAQGFFRIGGKSYISYNINREGELWEYSDPDDQSPTTTSITSNEATLTFASDHKFVVGDEIVVENIGSPFDTGTQDVSEGARTFYSVPDGHVITAVTNDSITFALTSADSAETSVSGGNVYRVTKRKLSADINGSGDAIRGMAPSLDNSKIYLADPLGNILAYDFDSETITKAGSLVAIDYGPDDITVLGDGTFLLSAYNTGGFLWHVDAQGNPIKRIKVQTAAKSYIIDGYDLRVAPDGSAIYFAARREGFLSIPMDPPLPGRSYGVSTAFEPPVGTPKALTSQPADVLSSSVDNVSLSEATLNGVVNANGTTSNAFFEYSTDPTFPSGSTTTTQTESVTGSTDTNLSSEISSLNAGSTYYFRLVVNNGADRIEGAVRSFTTLVPPTISAATVSSGPAVGGTAITLTGVGLGTPTEVKVGNTVITAGNYTAGSTQIQLTTPAQTGTNVRIRTANGVAVSTFNYDSPTIASLSSDAGQAGDTLTFTGANFTGATGVTIDGVPMTNVTVVSDTSVTADVPNGTGADLDIILTTPSGNVTRAAAFSYGAGGGGGTPPSSSSNSTYSGSQPFFGGVEMIGCALDSITFTGTTLYNLDQVTVGGEEVDFEILSDRVIQVSLGCLSAGEHALTFHSRWGNNTAQGMVTVVSERLTVASTDQKLNAGSFKGYVALYAKGYEGRRLSAKVGKDWVIVPSLESRFERVVEFTGAGVDIRVRMYIDRALMKTIELITK